MMNKTSLDMSYFYLSVHFNIMIKKRRMKIKKCKLYRNHIDNNK